MSYFVQSWENFNAFAIAFPYLKRATNVVCNNIAQKSVDEIVMLRYDASYCLDRVE